jgi:hypothetical protein
MVELGGRGAGGARLQRINTMEEPAAGLEEELGEGARPGSRGGPGADVNLNNVRRRGALREAPSC